MNVFNDKVLFFGFDFDYEVMSIEQLNLTRDGRIRHYFYSRLWKYICSRNKVGKFFTYILQFYTAFYLDYIVKPDILVLKDDRFYLKIAELSKTKKIFIFRNVASDEIVEMCGDNSMFTFDENDALKYGMTLYNQFTPAYEILKYRKFKEEYDATFIGYDKGRKAILESLVSLNEDINFNIKLVQKEGRLKRLLNLLLRQGNSNYEQFINQQYSTKCVIDIVKENQYNETMRYIEALIAKRKIITNNLNIFSNPLYCYDNVYVLGQDDRALSEFIAGVFKPISDDSLKEFSSTVVLNRIINSVK